MDGGEEDSVQKIEPSVAQYAISEAPTLRKFTESDYPSRIQNESHMLQFVHLDFVKMVGRGWVTRSIRKTFVVDTTPSTSSGPKAAIRVPSYSIPVLCRSAFKRLI